MRRLLGFVFVLQGCTCGQPSVTMSVPQLAPLPQLVDFGVVPEGSSVTQRLPVSNLGRAVLEVSASLSKDSASDFVLNAGALTLLGGEEGALEVTFTPTGAGQDVGWIVLETNEEPHTERLIELRGGPIAPVVSFAPSPLRFPNAQAWVERAVVNVENIGTATLSINDVGVEEGGNPDFSVRPLPRGTTLLPGEHVAIQVTYSRSTRAEPGAVVVLSNDPVTPRARVELVAAPVGRCGNGIDDDRDGRTDYPDDPGCDGVNDDDESDPAVCLDGALLRCGSDVGECRAGQRTCTAGSFGQCLGAIEPATELCDGKDNNCNGQIDEGLVDCQGPVDGGAGGGAAGGSAAGGSAGGNSAGGSAGGSSAGGSAGGSSAGGSAGGVPACPSTGGHWERLASPSRTSHQAVWADGTFVVVGGNAGDGYPAMPTRYDATTFARTELDGGTTFSESCKSAFVSSARQVVTLCATAALSRRYGVDSNSWQPVNGSGFTAPGNDGFVVSTGSRLFVWDTATARGASYDPTGDVWSALPSAGAPVAPCCSGVTWSGSKVVLWGGTGMTALTASNAGYTFDPASNTWASLPTTGAPTPRGQALVAANATAVFVFGGYGSGFLQSGGTLDLASGQWRNLPSGPSVMLSSTAAAGAVGSKFVVVQKRHSGATAARGAVFDPATNAWTDLPTAGAPLFRENDSITFTPEGVTFIGGSPSGVGPSSMLRGHVHRWVAATNGWVGDATLEPPFVVDHAGSSAGNATLAWVAPNGPALLLNAAWGIGSAGRFDPATRTWQPISMVGVPIGSSYVASAWSGTQLLTFGRPTAAPGASYDLATDSWSPWPALASAPSARYDPVTGWLGTRLFVWGTNGSFVQLDSRGGLFDPSTQTWTSTALFGAPSPRVSLSSGSAVIGSGKIAIWGGTDSSNQPLGDGAIYDSATDTWSAMASTGAPSARARHAAVWTGRELLIWGGSGGRTGAAYNPATDTWRPMNALNAPVEGPSFVAGVWTGSKAIFLSNTGRGGMYDPATDSWSCMPTASAPSFTRPLMAWTPQGLLVFGMRQGSAPTNSGALFIP